MDGDVSLNLLLLHHRIDNYPHVCIHGTHANTLTLTHAHIPTHTPMQAVEWKGDDEGELGASFTETPLDEWDGPQELKDKVPIHPVCVGASITQTPLDEWDGPQELNTRH